MALPTFATGTTGVVTIKQVTSGGALVTALAPGDAITVKVFDRTDIQQGATVDASGNNAGDYAAEITFPATTGAYYAQVDLSIDGKIGRQTIDFIVQKRVTA